MDHPDFKKVIADIYSTQVLQMGEIDWNVGFQNIIEILMRKMNKLPDSKKSFYMGHNKHG